jgi:diphthamide synthase (EF-2-diphthine--ammonia ligase)
MFNSYKIETVYEANVVDEDGEFKTMIFDSEDDYKKYISPYHDENEIEDMVEDFLRERDKKVYCDPLFKIAF